ncbi:MAG: TenA family protein [Acidimicrobiia bacterium]|nr:TenA family protein [Acidimicrobiia bacterium]
MSRYRRLQELARPWVAEKYDRPVVRGIFDGTLDPAVMRYWIEQDHLYLLEYARTFCRVASHAPDAHLETLVDGAHYTLNDELRLHRGIAETFDADLSVTTMGPACQEYCAYLRAESSRFASGVLAVLPCMMGFAALGLQVSMPDEPRYRRWVQTYASTEFQGYSTRYAAVVDDIEIGDDDADRIFNEGMRLELAFWDEAAQAAADPAERSTR